ARVRPLAVARGSDALPAVDRADRQLPRVADAAGRAVRVAAARGPAGGEIAVQADARAVGAFGAARAGVTSPRADRPGERDEPVFRALVERGRLAVHQLRAAERARPRAYQVRADVHRIRDPFPRQRGHALGRRVLPFDALIRDQIPPADLRPAGQERVDG